MVNERTEYKAYDFWFLFEKFNKDLKRVNVKKVTAKCAIVLLYWLYVIASGRSCFHFILLPERSKTRAYFASLNN